MKRLGKLGKPTTFVGLLLFALIVVGHLGVAAYQVLTTTLAFFVAGVALIPLHEAGHALLGWLVGIRVARVIVGHGPLLAQKRVGKVLWQLKRIPLGGMTVGGVPERGGFPRLRLVLFVLGGPLVNLAVAWLCWRWQARLAEGGAAQGIVAAVGGASIGQLVLNLLPLRLAGDGAPMKSDGLQLITIPLMKKTELPQHHAAEYLFSAADELEAGRYVEALAWVERGIERLPTVHGLRLLRATALYHLGRVDETLDQLASMLAEGDDVIRTIALNDWSWYAFLRGDERDLALADRRSAQALALRPENPALAGTRGTVLLWQGHVTEAMPSLERSFEHAESSEARSVTACVLAMAYAAEGRVSAAEKSLATARASKPDQALLPRAEAAVATARQWQGQPRIVSAPRGSRAVVVNHGALTLVGGLGAAPTSLAFDDISKLRAGLTARGKALLIIRHAGGCWRMPVDRQALGSVRLALAPAISAHAVPASSAIHRPAERQRDLGAIARTLCTAVTIAFGTHGPVSSGSSSFLALALGTVGLLAPGPAPILALGLSICLEIVMGFVGVTVNPRDGGFWGCFWLALWAAMGAGAAVVGWLMRKEAAEKRRRGRLPTVIFLAIAAFPDIMSPIASIGFDSSPRRLGQMFQPLGALGVAATTLAAALWVSMQRRRWAIALPALAGAAGLLMGSDWFHEATVRSAWGPRPPALTWSTRNAEPLLRIELPTGAAPLAISPDGAAWLALETDSPRERQAATVDDDLSSARAARARVLVGGFTGQSRAVPGFAARFIDKRSFLVLASGDGGRWEAREVALADPTIPTHVAMVSGGPPPSLFRDEPDGPVYVLESSDRDQTANSPRRWIWSSGEGLSSAPDFDTSEAVLYIDADGRLVGTESGLLRCPGWLAREQLLCVAVQDGPVQLVAYELDEGTHRRLASVFPKRGQVHVLPGGRVAMVIGPDLVIVDVVARAATRLVLPPVAGDDVEHELVAGGLAVATHPHRAGAETRTTLTVFASP